MEQVTGRGGGALSNRDAVVAGALGAVQSDRFEVRSFVVERITLPAGYSPPEETP